MVCNPIPRSTPPERSGGPEPDSTLDGVGLVIIGRNEGERLRRCLLSVNGRGPAVVYVDSGSHDGSVELARRLGAAVVELDPSIPFTAARARNEGTARLLEVQPDTRLVQFLDGDCEMIDGWLESAVAELERHPDVAVVCGRLRERYPDRSVYNRLADIEWDRPVGELKACGGIVMVRLAAFLEVGGFEKTVFAGEEDELCLRLRRRGWRLVRIPAEMALHDMDMSRFRQWWRRASRTGRAYGLGIAMHGFSGERFCIRPAASILFWGAFVPLAILTTVWISRGFTLLIFASYYLLYRRIEHGAMAGGMPRTLARLYARFCVLAKFPQFAGLAGFAISRLAGGLVKSTR